MATGRSWQCRLRQTPTWHRRLGHLNPKSLSLLKNLDNNGLSCDGRVPDCDVCAVGNSHQLAHPKTADHKVKLPFQLVFADLMGPLTPEALGGYMYITKISDEYTKWTEPYLLKSKHDALSSFQVFVQSVMIPNGFRVERLKVDKGGELSARSSRTTAFRRGCRSSTPAPTRRSKSACPNALEGLLQLWCGVCLPTADCQGFCGEN